MIWTKNAKTGVYNIDPVALYLFAERKGFIRLDLNFDDPDDKDLRLRRIKDNVIYKAMVSDFQQCVQEEIKEKAIIEFDEIYNTFLNKAYKLMSQAVLQNNLPILHLKKDKKKFLHDTADKSYFVFRNCAVEVTKDSIKILKYKELPGLIFEDDIIQRDYVGCDSEKSFIKRIFQNVADKNHPDHTTRVKSIRTSIGYLCHRYQDLANPKIVIFTDDSSDDSTDGGTGKSFLSLTTSILRNFLPIPGKSFNFHDPFKWQLVKTTTNIIRLDDVNDKFDFEDFFEVAGSLNVNPKNKSAFNIPAEDVPKIAITSQHSLKGIGGSFDRRQIIIVLSNYYHINPDGTKFGPKEEFGFGRFDDWSEEQFNIETQFLLECVQEYLNTGTVNYPSSTYKLKAMAKSTSESFVEWARTEGNIPFEEKIERKSLLRSFQAYSDEQKDKDVNMVQFKSWIDRWCKYQGWRQPESKRSNGKDWWTFYKPTKSLFESIEDRPDVFEKFTV